MIKDPLEVEVQLENVALKDLKVLLGRLINGACGGIGTRGKKGDKGVTGSIGQQGHVAPQGSTVPQGITGPRGGQEAAGKIGPKGDPSVTIDIVAEFCKHLPIAIVELYRRDAYARYAINSMEDIELHDAVHVKTIIDKGGRCSARQSNVRGMTTLLQTRVNSNYVHNLHNDAYNMEANMHNFHYFCAFLIYKIKACVRIEHWGRNYLISNWSGDKETKYRGILFLTRLKDISYTRRMKCWFR